MPFSSGTYTVAVNFTTEAGSPPIEIAKLDQQMQDIATALSLCMLRDGTGTPTAAISFGTQDVTGVQRLTVADSVSDRASVSLTRAGSQLWLARSSDGALSFSLGSDTVGGSGFSIKNAGGVTTEIKMFQSTIEIWTNAIKRLVLSSTGNWPFIAATSGNTVTVASASAIPAGGNVTVGVCMTTTANFGVFCGSGAPSMSAAKGSLYLRSDGASNVTRAYINTDGAGTWTAINTVA